MLIKLFIVVNRLEEVLNRYDKVYVYRSITGIDGTFSKLSEVDLEAGRKLYEYFDASGEANYWYKTAFVDSATAAASAFSDPFLGDDSVALSHIMTVQDLKDIYLTGIDLTDDAGNPYPDIMYEFGIRAAMAWLEETLAIKVRPTVIPAELHDYDQLAWQQMAFLQLDYYPVISVESLSMIWPTSNDPYVFPSDWIRLQANAGQINLVPTSGTLSQAMVIAGSYLPSILSNVPYVPNAISVAYTAGFAYGNLPASMRDMIGMKASFPILNTAGDLIAGAGIANFSLSVDGLSQTVGTTSSATNSGYGARILAYERRIKSELPTLRKFYKNVGLAMA